MPLYWTEIENSKELLKKYKTTTIFWRQRPIFQDLREWACTVLDKDFIQRALSLKNAKCTFTNHGKMRH